MHYEKSRNHYEERREKMRKQMARRKVRRKEEVTINE